MFILVEKIMNGNNLVEERFTVYEAITLNNKGQFERCVQGVKDGLNNLKHIYPNSSFAIINDDESFFACVYFLEPDGLPCYATMKNKGIGQVTFID